MNIIAEFCIDAPKSLSLGQMAAAAKRYDKVYRKQRWKTQYEVLKAILVKIPKPVERKKLFFSECILYATLLATTHGQAICLNGRFNNHFKDEQHFQSVVSSFLGTILPKVTSHTFSEICEGSAEGRILHFHKIDEEHRRIVREVLECYSFSAQIIDQMFEGNNIFEFSANLGHVYAARIVCHKLGNVLSLLFF